MGKNTPERQKFIINNLQVEKDLEELTNIDEELDPEPKEDLEVA